VTIETLPLSKIEVDPAVNVREKLDEETIDWYTQVLDDLPPPVAFRLNGRLLLADGFHRWAAATRLGRNEMRVEIREGTEDEAWEYAALANWKNPKSLTPRDRETVVGRMAHLHPKWTQDQLAKELKMARSTVTDYLRAIDLRKLGRHADAMPTSHLTTIAAAPEAYREKLLKRPELTRDEVRAAVRTLNDPKIDDEYKERMLAGEAPPLTERGGVLRPTILREIEKARERDGILALWKITEVMSAAKARFEPAEIAQQAEAKDIPQLLRLLPDQRAWLDAVIASLEAMR
jgi:ParB-like chromosome segregation protein Spo0J